MLKVKDRERRVRVEVSRCRGTESRGGGGGCIRVAVSECRGVGFYATVHPHVDPMAKDSEHSTKSPESNASQLLFAMKTIPL